jgi:hypothetical protein
MTIKPTKVLPNVYAIAYSLFKPALLSLFLSANYPRTQSFALIANTGDSVKLHPNLVQLLVS